MNTQNAQPNTPDTDADARIAALEQQIADLKKQQGGATMNDSYYDEHYHVYRVEYHTQPTPGLMFYQGATTVFADNEDEALDRARHKLASASNGERQYVDIIIESVEEISQ